MSSQARCTSMVAEPWLGEVHPKPGGATLDTSRRPWWRPPDSHRPRQIKSVGKRHILPRTLTPPHAVFGACYGVPLLPPCVTLAMRG